MKVKVQIVATIPGTEALSPQDVPAKAIEEQISKAIAAGALEPYKFKKGTGNVGLYAQLAFTVKEAK